LYYIMYIHIGLYLLLYVFNVIFISFYNKISQRTGDVI